MNNHTINFLAALCATAMFASAPAWAGEITGKITDAATGLPIAGACATAFGTNDVVESPPTGANGVYTISNLVDDEWEVLATDCSVPVTYSAVDYKNIPGLNRSRAKFIKIKKLDTVKKKVNFELPVAGHVLVHLRDFTNQNVPITNVLVCPYGSAPDKKGNIFQSDFCLRTDSQGDALFNVVAGGNKFQVINDPLVCWYGDEDNFNDATVVNAPAGQTVDINFFLNSPGAC